MLIRSILVLKSVFRARICVRILATDTGARNYSRLDTAPGPLRP